MENKQTKNTKMENTSEGTQRAQRYNTYLCISCVGPPWGPGCHLPFSPVLEVGREVQVWKGVEEAPPALMPVRYPCWPPWREDNEGGRLDGSGMAGLTRGCRRPTWLA